MLIRFQFTGNVQIFRKVGLVYIQDKKKIRVTSLRVKIDCTRNRERTTIEKNNLRIFCIFRIAHSPNMRMCQRSIRFHKMVFITVNKH